MIPKPPYRWRKLRKVRADVSELRYRCTAVTVCIAAIHSNDTVITVSDKRITFSGIVSTEGEMGKLLPTHSWLGLIAGENVSAAMPILLEVEGKDTGDLTVDEFSAICREAYRRQQTIGIESTILSKYDMTIEQFKKTGSTTFTDKVYEHLVEGMEEYDLGAQFLFAGFDPICAPHIFTLTHPGKVQIFDRTGYWAIGSGKHAAISHLSSYPYKRSSSLAECIYQAISAKFAAESATDVGRDTDVVVKMRSCPSPMQLPEDLIDYVRASYDRIQRIPVDAVEAIDLEMKRFDLGRELQGKIENPLVFTLYENMLTPDGAKLVAKQHEKLQKKRLAKRTAKPSRRKVLKS